MTVSASSREAGAVIPSDARRDLRGCTYGWRASEESSRGRENARVSEGLAAGFAQELRKVDGMHAPPETVRSDFDRIARLTEQCCEPGRAERASYEAFLLRHVPQPCETALEIGCGTGDFARKLAERAGHVLAVDLSPEMIWIARTRSAGHPNLEYCVADVAAWPFPPGAFDCIATVATLHHLPAARLLRDMKESLRPGGTLLVQDVLDRPGVRGLPVNALAMGVRFLHRLRAGALRDPPALRAAWAEHGRGERYLRMADVRELCAAELPGALVREHLLWRFSIVWRKPA